MQGKGSHKYFKKILKYLFKLLNIKLKYESKIFIRFAAKCVSFINDLISETFCYVQRTGKCSFLFG